MTRNYFLNYTSLDLETTGLNPLRDDIIEVALIKVRDGNITERFSSFVYTPLVISDHVSYLTGITASDLTNAPDFIDLIPKLEHLIGDDPILGHNIAFDAEFLRQKGVKVQNNELWDTYLLSNLLYPELPSHSLETNTKYFGITHEDSHRAMDDVLASHELWKILVNTSVDLSPSQRERIATLAKKSTWPLLRFFLQDSALQKKQVFSSPIIQFPARHLPRMQMADQTQQVLIEARGADPVETALRIPFEQKTLFLAGSEKMKEKLAHGFPDAFLLRMPWSYLSLEKLQRVFEKPSLTDAEAMLLLKTILRPSAVTQEDLRLTHPERIFWKSFSCAEEKHVFPKTGYFYETYQKVLGARKVIASHSLIFLESSLLSSFDQIVVLEPQLLEENATWFFGKTLDEEQWMNVLSDQQWQDDGKKLYRQIKSLADVLVPSTLFSEQVVITPMIAEEFQPLKSLISDMAQKITNVVLKSHLESYEKFFQKNDPESIRWLTVFRDKRVTLHRVPLSVGHLLPRALFEKSCLIISDTGSDFPFLPKMQRQNLTEPISIKTILPPLPQISGTKREGDHPKLISYLASELPKFSGKTGIIFSSKAVLKRYFFDLAKTFPDFMHCFGEELSGGRGKLRDRFLTSNANHKILFYTFRHLPDLPYELLDFDQIFLQSLPFDPPGIPIHQERSKLVQHAFRDYTLPRTKQYFLEILSAMTKRSSPRTFIFLDKRVQEKEYGEEFLKLISLFSV